MVVEAWGGRRNGPYASSLPHLCHFSGWVGWGLWVGGRGRGRWLEGEGGGGGGGAPGTPVVVLIILSHVLNSP